MSLQTSNQGGKFKKTVENKWLFMEDVSEKNSGNQQGNGSNHLQQFSRRECDSSVHKSRTLKQNSYTSYSSDHKSGLNGKPTKLDINCEQSTISKRISQLYSHNQSNNQKVNSSIEEDFKNSPTLEKRVSDIYCNIEAGDVITSNSSTKRNKNVIKNVPTIVKRHSSTYSNTSQNSEFADKYAEITSRSSKSTSSLHNQNFKFSESHNIAASHLTVNKSVSRYCNIDSIESNELLKSESFLKHSSRDLLKDQSISHNFIANEQSNSINSSSKRVNSYKQETKCNSKSYTNEDSERIPYSSQLLKENTQRTSDKPTSALKSTSGQPPLNKTKIGSLLKRQNSLHCGTSKLYSNVYSTESPSNVNGRMGSSYNFISNTSHSTYLTKRNSDYEEVQTLQIGEKVINSNEKKNKIDQKFHRSNVSYLNLSPNTSVKRTTSLRYKVARKHSSIEQLIKHFDGPLYQNFFDEKLPEIVYPDQVIPIKLPENDEWTEKEEYEEASEVFPDDSKNKADVIKDLVNEQSVRKLWCQMPQVISSPILSKLSKKESHLYEAKFEILSSEASYYKSLAVLEMHFAWSKALTEVITKAEYNYLFAHVKEVRQVSEIVLREISHCYNNSILMTGLSNLLIELAKDHFQCYIKICKSQSLVEKTYRELVKKHEFVKVINQLESSPKCQNLTLNSFLMLPVQRVTRMPILLQSIIKKLSPNDTEYKSWQEAYQLFKQIANDCNKACGELNDLEKKLLKLREVTSTLHFTNNSNLQPLPLFSSKRYVEQEDLFTYLSLGDKSNISVGDVIKLVLFNDYLILAKAMGNKQFYVLYYSLRDKVCIVPMESDCGYHIKLIFAHETGNGFEEWVLDSSYEEKCKKWLQLLTPNITFSKFDIPEIKLNMMKDSEKQNQIFQVGDKIVANYPYKAQQNDELNFEIGDEIMVIKKVEEGWYIGKNLKDNKTGCFPCNYFTKTN